MRRALILASSMALLIVLFVPPAAAGRLDQYTISHLTFSGSVGVPGVVLPAGTYTFKRVLPGVIQVLSKDHMTLYGTFMTIPQLRSERTTKQEVVLGEVRVGEPPPIAVWYPFPEPAWFNYHRSVGYRFLYDTAGPLGTK
jgi:hypothetical protein